MPLGLEEAGWAPGRDEAREGRVQGVERGGRVHHFEYVGQFGAHGGLQGSWHPCIRELPFLLYVVPSV